MSKKKIITIVSVLAVILLSVSVISYSIANRGNGGNNKISDNLAQRGAGTIESTYVTNIDLIIENSKKSPIENYNIVEIIPSSASPSVLGKYISDDLFKEYVIDENSTSTPKTVMAADAIKLDVIKVSAGTTMDDKISSNILGGNSTIREILDETDLIYLSSPSYSAYDGNMSEDIYNYLHTYALGKNKPMIMDYVTQGSSGSTEKTSYTYSELVKTISNNHIRFKTFAWQPEAEAKDFFGRDTSKGSYYITYNTNNNPVNGNVLVITNSDGNSDSTMSGKMKKMKDKELIDLAYYGNKKPESMEEYKVIKPSELNNPEVLDEEYDFILIENDVASETMSKEIYTKLRSLSESGRYILYDGRLAESSGETTTPAATASNNYLKLMQLLLTNKGLAKYSHILPVSNGYFDALNAAGDSGVEGAKAIADIINAGDYRGSGSNGTNGKIFRVLELQPCYPIDLEIAQKATSDAKTKIATFGMKGNYYLSPSDLTAGMTKDEVEAGAEYYDFDLSRAKIAKATGLNYKQIQVDQMSTNEFISKKDVVIETYDLVYIGGNTSALTPHTNFGVLGGSISQEHTQYAWDYFTSFDMYTHTGLMSALRVAKNSGAGPMSEIVEAKGQTVEYPVGKLFINNKPVDTVTEYNGNDINSLKYEELNNYVTKGMPVIVEKTVADAFEKAKQAEGNRLSQLALRDIDPDSYMYRILNDIYALQEKSSVVWGLDATHHEELDEDGNADRLYGNTLGAAVTLFDQEVNDKISAVMSAGAVRPTLAVTSMPKEYSEGNPNSYNKYADGFVISAYAKPAITSGSNEFDMSLYIDLDGNGVFSDVLERVNQKEYTYAEPEDGAAPKTVDLTYTLPENFYGIVSWKVVAKDKATGLVSSVTGYAYYEREETAAKKEIEILQILPRSSGNKAAMEEALKSNKGKTLFNTGVTLYLCTECQMHRYRAEYNVYADNEDIGYNSFSTVSVDSGVSLGLHEHKFGIPQYNTNTQNEDWDSNLADVLTGPDGDYEADIDIMYADEFESLIAKIKGQSEEAIEANKILMQKAYADMETAEKDPAYINAEKAVKEYLISLQGNSKYKNSEHFKEYAEAGDYYKLWMYNIKGLGGTIDSDPKLSEYRTLYNKYVEYNDKVVRAKKEYREYRRLAYRTDQWMANNYSIVVLGWAEDFGGEDLNDDACAMLTDYIKRGGSMLNTHDSTTKYAKAGAMNLTEKLRGAFGMDRFHITGTAEGSSGSGTAEASSVIAKLDIPSYAYSPAVEQPADTTYVLKVWSGQEQEVKRFILKKDEQMKSITANVYLQIANGQDPVENYANITSNFTDETIVDDKSTITIYTKKMGYGGEHGTQETAEPQANVPVTIYRVDKGEYNEKLTSVVNGRTDNNGMFKFNALTLGTEIVQPAKMTKALSDSAMVVLKDTDQTYSVKLTADGDYNTSNSITLKNSGNAHTDLEEKLQVTFQLQFPVELTTELKNLLETNPLTCKITHNGKTYTSEVKTDGTVTFEIPIVSSMADGNISADSLRYRHFTTDGEQYRLTERALSEDYVQWNQFMVQTEPPAQFQPNDGWKWQSIHSNWMSMGYNNPVGVTDYFIMYQTNEQFSPYRYVESETIAATSWDVGYPSKVDKETYGPLGASQVNKGIVTTYPFLISSELKIAQTHAQTYALDLDDKDVAVWYTLAPGINRTAGVSGAKTAASLYAASPHDGMNNYYLYSKGNIFYCGSGHSLVTGPKIDNNDERRLFINVIVNSVRNAAEKPKITVHRKDTDGAEVKEDKNEKLNVDGSGNYYYNVDDNEEIPEFDFRVTVDSKADLGEVYVFYDLDYGLIVDGETNSSNAYEVNDKHVLIAEYNTKSADSGALASKELAKLRKYVEKPESGYKNLQLKPEYFEAYGGNYTYIVIQATDTNGKTAFQRIKINLIPKLWELTMTEPANNRILLDVSDRVKYNI